MTAQSQPVEKERSLIDVMLETIDQNNKTLAKVSADHDEFKLNALRKSVEYENEKKALNKEIAEQHLIANKAMMYLGKMIEEFEGAFDNDETVSSIEYGIDLLATYEFLEKAHGRDIGRNNQNSVYNRLNEWVQNYPLPVKR